MKPTNSFIRFALVGAINTAAGLSIMLFLLNAAGVSYWMATFLGNAFGAVISYFLNRTFTFKSSVPFLEGAPKFIAVILICYFLSYSASGIISQAAGFLPQNVRDNAAVLLGSGFYTIANYFGQKKFVFRKPVIETIGKL